MKVYRIILHQNGWGRETYDVCAADAQRAITKAIKVARANKFFYKSKPIDVISAEQIVKELYK